MSSFHHLGFIKACMQSVPPGRDYITFEVCKWAEFHLRNEIGQSLA